MRDSCESNVSISKGKTTTACPTTPTLFTMHQLIWNLKFERDLDFIRRRAIWTKVWPYVRSAEQLISTAVERQIWKLTWWDCMEKTMQATRRRNPDTCQTWFSMSTLILSQSKHNVLFLAFSGKITVLHCCIILIWLTIFEGVFR